MSTNSQILVGTLRNIYKDFQIDIGIKFQSNSRRIPTDLKIRYKHI